MPNKIRMIELFSGIGAQAQAMKEVGLDFESLCCEIDPKAYKSYCAIHGDTPNLGDITKVEHLPPCDLLFFSFPCQSISMAGKREGFEEGSGTESSLLWEVIRLLKDMRERDGLPLTLIMENVKALTFKKNLPGFQKLIDILSELGYTSTWKVLNAKDYGTPQNRERVFMVSRLDGKKFIFPEPCPDGRVLRDVLEENVPENFYLSQEKIAHYEQHRIRQEENNRRFGWEPKGSDVIAKSITCNADRHCSNWLVEQPKCICENIIENVSERVNEVNLDALYTILVDAKKSKGLTTKEISSSLKVDKTTVEHWFRHDKYQSIPDPESWHKLKELLEITDNSLDSAICEFTQREGSYESGQKCYSSNGLSPTIKACQDIKVSESGSDPIKAGNLHLKSAFGQANDVHSIDGSAPTITTCHVGIGQPKIEVAGDLKIKNWHRLANEVLSPDGLSAVVYSQSNNLKRKVEIAGDLNRPEYQDRMNRVYDSDGLAPTMVCTSSGGMQPKIQVVGDLHIPGESETNNRVHSAEGICPTVQAQHKKIIEDKQERLRESSAVATDLDTGSKIEPEPRKDGVLHTDTGLVRIRYLTPRECWRLQGFPDEAFDAAVAAGMTKTALYAQAGNSIAVPVLKAIFKGIYIDESFEPEKKEWF